MSEKQKRPNTAQLLREKQGLIESIKSRLSGDKPPFASQVKPSESFAPVSMIPDTDDEKPVPDFEPEDKTIIRTVYVEKSPAPADPTADTYKTLIGKWKVVSHTTSGDDYRLHFEMTHLNGKKFRTAAITETFEFREHICLKETSIDGTLDDGRTYRYKLNLTTTFTIPRADTLAIKIESGYLSRTVGTEAPAVKDYSGDGKTDEIGFRFDGETLIMEDVYRDDRKSLTRLA
ncbi:MAG: hypothetical protein A2Y33_14985 [Spirochaetes bacterium GWF1_51_8]|nr:MAG: hypothetical protein A2Y33_14985 [Spirochaetes bacterium GWF1_51_8]